MSNYAKIRKLDLESAKQMIEGKGPVDECLCSVLGPSEDLKPGLRNSLKKVFRSVSGRKKRKAADGSSGVVIPLNFGKGIRTEKETVKRKKACGKGVCGTSGCGNHDLVLNHTYANLEIITPDVATICPCPNECFPKDKLNNIKLTVERMELHPDVVDSEDSVAPSQATVPEPHMEKRPIGELIEAEFYGTATYSCCRFIINRIICENFKCLAITVHDIDDPDIDNTPSEWSFGVEEAK